MLLKSVTYSIKTIVSVLLLGFCGTSFAQAKPLQCESETKTKAYRHLCLDAYSELRSEFNEKSLTTYLVTDAPLRLIHDTHLMWLERTKQCKTNECIQQLFNLRIEDLNFYTSMNQTLTQHYLKFEQGQIAKQPIHLKIHQLTKDRIKIEGLAYRNPNNRTEKQSIPLLAYTTPEQKNIILDNEHDCKYQLNFQKALLQVTTKQKGCERFVGTYRLYD